MKKIMQLVACATMAMTLVACGGGSSTSAEDTLVYGCEELEGVFSPLYYSSSYDGYVKDLVYDSMLAYNYDGELVTSLASEMPTYTNDGKTLTFKLQKGIKFSNGDKLTADDVKLTFEVLADKTYTGRNSYMVTDFVGYQDYYDGKADEVTGIKVVDDYTVEFNFNVARSDNIYNIGTMGIISDKQFKKYSNGKATKVIEKAKSDAIGTGPYTLTSFSKSEGAVLVKNDKYWGKGYDIKNVIIRPVEMTTEYEEIKSGNIDVLQQSIEASKVAQGSKNKDITMNTYSRAGYGFVCFNTAEGATTEKEVRQALMYAFNREKFVSSYFACEKCAEGVGQDLGYVPATIQNAASPMGDIVTGKEKVDGLNTYEFNLDTANALLDQAGWVKGDDGIRTKDGKKLTVRMMAMEEHDICNTLIPMWKSDWKAIGVDFQVTTVDFNTLLNKVQDDEALSEWNVFFMANSFTDASMAGIYSTYASSEAKTGGQNYSRLKDAALDEIMTNALRSVDEAQQKALWTQAAIEINDQASYMPVYGNTYYEMIRNDRVENLKTNTLYPWTSGLRDATIKKAK